MQTLAPPEIRTTYSGAPKRGNHVATTKKPKEDSKADKMADKKAGIKEGSKRDMPMKKGKY